jgi:glycosyltransferase involved in cell wall biosynthesis
MTTARGRLGGAGVGVRRLRVGMVAPPYLPVPPTGYGGIERVVGTLTEGLVERGHDVTLYGAPGSKMPARVLTPLAKAPLLGDPAAVFDEMVHVLAAYLDAESFDVIHDHTGLGPILGSVLHSTPVVHTLHGPWTPRSRQLYAMMDERVHLVAISHHQQAANPSLRYAGVVHNGVDLQIHPFREAKEDFLVFMGRINPEKRPELAIQIARRAGRPIVMMVKRTEPIELEYWDRVVAPQLGRDVEVLDQPPHEVKVDVLGRARAMLFPIDWPEPFGLVMIEAMACGTPVIARPLGAVPEVVVDGITGYLCSTVDEMVRAVEMADRIRPVACRRHVEARFSKRAMVDGYERIYEALVGDSVATLVRGELPTGAARPGRESEAPSEPRAPGQPPAAVSLS